MYFRITKSFLNNYSKEHLVSLFSDAGKLRSKTKSTLINEIINNLGSHPEMGPLTPWLFICPFCRREYKLSVDWGKGKKPYWCVFCAKASPLHSLENNLQNTDILLRLASKMNLKTETDAKRVLIQQGLVIVISSLEVFMRQIYSLSYDFQHVLFGKPVYYDIYPKTRSSFLNLRTATTQIRKLTSYNLKKVISRDRYTFLSHMYSARHIVIHNSSIKDKEYINQTSQPKEDLLKPLKLSIQEVRRAKRIATEIGKKLDCVLRNTLLEYQKHKTNLEEKLKT